MANLPVNRDPEFRDDAVLDLATVVASASRECRIFRRKRLRIMNGLTFEGNLPNELSVLAAGVHS
jgi:hypothetical protein